MAQKKSEFRLEIRVPGTTANLGPGFDIFGMSFKLYNTFRFQFGHSAEFQTQLKNGNPLPFSPDDDMVRRAYELYFDRLLHSQEILPYSLRMELELPLRGGLGSSASAVVAGIVAANEVHKRYWKGISLPSERQLLTLMAELEGHPDNTSAAYLGGFVFAFLDENYSLHYYKEKFPGNIHCFLLSPDIQVSTNSSRKQLPEYYSLSDVIFNMSRIGVWMEFLKSSKPGDLKLALQDRIHTPFRLTEDFPIYPLLQELEKHCLGYSLSGSGPSILFFAERKRSIQTERKMLGIVSEYMKDLRMEYKFLRLRTDNLGCRVDKY